MGFICLVSFMLCFGPVLSILRVACMPSCHTFLPHLQISGGCNPVTHGCASMLACRWLPALLASLVYWWECGIPATLANPEADICREAMGSTHSPGQACCMQARIRICHELITQATVNVRLLGCLAVGAASAQRAGSGWGSLRLSTWRVAWMFRLLTLLVDLHALLSAARLSLSLVCVVVYPSALLLVISHRSRAMCAYLASASRCRCGSYGAADWPVPRPSQQRRTNRILFAQRITTNVGGHDLMASTV